MATLVEDGGGTTAASFDISALGFVLQQLKLEFHTNSTSIGGSSFDASKGVVVFHGLGRGTGWLLPRIAATLWPLSLLAVARFFFHRFDPARVRALPNERTHGCWLGRLNRLAKRWCDSGIASSPGDRTAAVRLRRCAVDISGVACREKRAATTALIFAMPGLRERFGGSARNALQIPASRQRT
ncbi:MAG TPA: hypothetical protein VHF69_04465 [Candidatus Synoicihabitans sp.]|nr:hypothetical protein [Candidatus Synoicihabitans sp.]